MIAFLSKNKCRMRHSPKAVTAAISIGGSQLSQVVNAIIEDLCKCGYFERMVFKYVLNHRGTVTQAEDVLQEGLIKTTELIRQGKYHGGQIEGFAIGICINIWKNMARKKDEQFIPKEKPFHPDENKVDTVTVASSALEEMEKVDILKYILQKAATSNCLKILRLKLIEGLRHEKIVEQLGLANVDSSRQRLSFCKKKVKKCLQDHPKYLNLLASVDIHLKPA